MYPSQLLGNGCFPPNHHGLSGHVLPDSTSLSRNSSVQMEDYSQFQGQPGMLQSGYQQHQQQLQQQQLQQQQLQQQQLQQQQQQLPNPVLNQDPRLLNQVTGTGNGLSFSQAQNLNLTGQNSYGQNFQQPPNQIPMMASTMMSPASASVSYSTQNSLGPVPQGHTQYATAPMGKPETNLSCQRFEEQTMFQPQIDPRTANMPTVEQMQFQNNYRPLVQAPPNNLQKSSFLNAIASLAQSPISSERPAAQGQSQGIVFENDPMQQSCARFRPQMEQPPVDLAFQFPKTGTSSASTQPSSTLTFYQTDNGQMTNNNHPLNLSRPSSTSSLFSQDIRSVAFPTMPRLNQQQQQQQAAKFIPGQGFQQIEESRTLDLRKLAIEKSNDIANFSTHHFSPAPGLLLNNNNNTEGGGLPGMFSMPGSQIGERARSTQSLQHFTEVGRAPASQGLPQPRGSSLTPSTSIFKTAAASLARPPPPLQAIPRRPYSGHSTDLLGQAVSNLQLSQNTTNQGQGQAPLQQPSGSGRPAQSAQIPTVAGVKRPMWSIENQPFSTAASGSQENHAPVAAQSFNNPGGNFPRATHPSSNKMSRQNETNQFRRHGMRGPIFPQVSAPISRGGNGVNGFVGQSTSVLKEKDDGHMNMERNGDAFNGNENQDKNEVVRKLMRRYDTDAPACFKGLAFKTIEGGYADILADKLEENYIKYRNKVVQDEKSLMTPYRFLGLICNQMKINVHSELFKFFTANQEVQYRAELYVGGFCGVAHAENFGMCKQLAAAHILARMRIHFSFIKPTSYALFPGGRYTKVDDKLKELCKIFELGNVQYSIFDKRKFNCEDTSPRWQCSVIVQNQEACVRSDHSNYGKCLAAKNMYLNFVETPAVKVVEIKDYYAVGAECPMLKEVHPSLILHAPSKNKIDWKEENGVSNTDPWLHDPTNESRYLFGPGKDNRKLTEFGQALEMAVEKIEKGMFRENDFRAGQVENRMDVEVEEDWG